MKAPFLIKLAVILPLLLFVDYLLMLALGCATCLFGFDNNFNCNSYCIVGKIILALSFIFFLWFIFPDIKRLINKKKIATPENS